MRLNYQPLSLIAILSITLLSNIYSQPVVIVEDNFVNKNKFFDLSKLIVLGTNTDTLSGYQITSKTDNNALTFQALNLTDSVQLYANYHDTTVKSTKALTCVDYIFPKIDRNLDTITVEFDMIWQILNSGETGRVNVILMHDYPVNRPVLGDADSLNKYHPFGRPNYSLRIRNTVSSTDKGFLMYGGNNDPDGKLYLHITDGVPKHWLAGAVPASYIGKVYPDSNSSFSYSTAVASITRWKHFTIVVTPEKFSFYHRNSSDTHLGKGTLVAEMVTPKEKPANYPDFYRWYNNIEALRFYFNGNKTNTFMANVKISTSRDILADNKSVFSNDDKTLVYPNPAKDFIHINNDKYNFYQIVNLMGVTVKTAPLTSTTINVSDLENGIYSLHLLGENKDFKSKLIINR